MANTLKFGNGKWATGKDTVLAFNDENDNFKPLPFSFSRASSATVVNQKGLIETVGGGEPRIDFKDNTKGSLLLEPSRSNLVTTSETLENYFNRQGSTLIVDNNAINPSGSSTSYILDSSATGSYKSIFRNESSAWDSKTLTMSCFAKKKTNDFIYFHNIGSVSGSPSVYFNIDSGTLGSVGSAWSNVKIENYGNDWYRCSATITFGTNTNYLYIANSDGNNNINSTIGSQTYLWGVQLEEGSYATSYIPTQGSAVTRLADSCSQTVPDGVIGQTEGVVYMDFIAQNTTGQSQSHFWLGASGNEIGLYGGSQFVFYSSGGVSINGGNIITGERYKVAFGYKANDYVAYINGSQVGTDTSATVPTMTGLRLGSYFNGTEVQKKNTTDFKLYNTRLSNSELQALTTI